MNAVVLWQPPSLSPELRAELKRLASGPLRLPGVGEDDPGMVVTVEPNYLPDAQAAADEMRASLDQRADRALIKLWLDLLAMCIQPTPGPDQRAAALAGAAFVCGNLPAAVWNEDTAREAGGTFKFWPSAAEIKQLLQPHADRLAGELSDLERIAQAPRHRQGPAREAVGYDPGPAPPPQITRRRPLRERGDDDIDPADAAEQDREARARVLAQLAALGVTPERADAGAQLAAMGTDITPKRAAAEPLQPSLLDALYVVSGIQGPRPTQQGPIQQDNPAPKRKRAGRLEVVR